MATLVRRLTMNPKERAGVRKPQEPHGETAGHGLAA